MSSMHTTSSSRASGDILMFHDDLVITLFCLLDFQSFLRARRTCKKWYTLSYESAALCHHYDTAHLDRAWGPATWHSPQTLNKMLLRIRQLNANLGSAVPVIRSHRILQLPRNTSSHSHHILGRFLFLLGGEKSLVCYDLDGAELETLWTHEFPNRSGDRRICCCENHDTTEIGRSLVSLVVADNDEVSVFKLHIRRQGNLVEVTQKDKTDYRWEYDITENIAIQGDWLLCWSGNGTQAQLFHAPSVTKYVLDRDEDYHRNVVFAGQRFVASLMGAFGCFSDAIAIYDIPSPGPESESSDIANHERGWTYRVPLINMGIDHFTFLHVVEQMSGQPTELVTTVRFVVRRYPTEEDPNTRTCMALLNIKLSPDPNDILYTINPCLEIPDIGSFMFGRCRLGTYYLSSDSISDDEHFDVHHGYRSNLFYVPITAVEDGVFHFGEQCDLKLPDGIGFQVVEDTRFDEILGRIYLLNTPGQGQIHVVSYA